ncbi:metal ABC transporter substrate-binding protein [Moraxella nasovis]|uniref:metal ABC transporter substrate-binding protein n=1 Tax=Moraxella nasovis TaxID=2904121 RepID=UPI001F6212F0|nr:metal ABC transporter substrate-binding protein [Moraxella nasovis]UNU72699.1 metal ABC transporter substrate-binding protein [Moraxella nasovis]
MAHSKTITQAIKYISCAAVLLTCSMAQAGMVSVSNYPLSLLSNEVTKGDTSANVLLSAGDVGHHGELSPSGIKAIQDSAYVVWFGESLEQNLANSLNKAPNAISLLKFNAFNRYPIRNTDGTNKPNTEDVHIWLDPNNAKAIVRALAVIHGHANPDKQALYAKNAQNFAKRMDAAVARVSQSPSQSYWAYHDSYQYLEKVANLKFAGALTPDHHLSPKASQIKLLKQTRPKSHMCIVSQSAVSQGIQNKIGNVNVIVRQEDMSDGKDFISAWTDLVTSIQNCAKS